MVQLIWKKKKTDQISINCWHFTRFTANRITVTTRNKTMHKLSKQFNIYLTHNWLSLCYLLGRTLIFDSILSFNLLDWHNFQQIIHILFSSWISNRTIDSHHRAMWKYTYVCCAQMGYHWCKTSYAMRFKAAFRIFISNRFERKINEHIPPNEPVFNLLMTIFNGIFRFC